MQCCSLSSVDSQLLQSRDWTVAWSSPWKYKANILETEAHALNCTVEHLLRANRNIGKHVVCLVDNLPAALFATKGRGKSHLLKGPLRKIASLLLATGSRLHVRWIPSELNIADRPSRVQKLWEAQGLARWWHRIFEDPERFANGTSRRSNKVSRNRQTEKGPAATPVPQNLIYLESRSVRSPTLGDYQMRIDRFALWCAQINTIVALQPSWIR